MGHFTIAEGLEFLFIADAMGHGAPAALVTAMAYSTTMTVADIIRTEPSYRDSPGALLERINRIIYEAVRGTISMTFFASIIDLNKGTLIYANAGHNFPVVLPLDATDSRLGKASKSTQKSGGVQPISLKLMGTPLGIDPTSTFKEQTFEFKAGDKLFYFTDGLIECVSPKGEQWGRKHLLAEVGLGASMGPKQLCDDIVKKAFDFFGGVPLADDITVVVAEIGKTWKKKTGDEPVELTPSATKVAVATPPAALPAAAAPVAAPAMPLLHTTPEPPAMSVPPAPIPKKNEAQAEALMVELEMHTQAVEIELESIKAAMPTAPAPAQVTPPAPAASTSDAPVPAPAAPAPAAPLPAASAPRTIVAEEAPVHSKPAASGKYKLKLPSAG